ncbi:MAG: hypothetical protein D6785_13740 [Planctomycetota bacterium]|nr:MAG: hypothetical protein D6785_13740 [Planctomycetota bacterium]
MKKLGIIFLILFTLFLIQGCDESSASPAASSTQSYSSQGSSTYLQVQSTPPTQAAVGNPYVYQIQATSSQGLPLSFQILNGPQGMSVSGNGEVNWIPGSNQTGNFSIIVEISDSQHSITHTWQIQVQVSYSNGNGSGNTGTNPPANYGSGGSGGGGIGVISQKTVTVSTSSGSITGKYYIYVPTSYTQSTPIPVLYSQHGAGGNGYQMVALWKNVAQTEGFIVVGQNSQSTGWNFSSDIKIFQAIKQKVEQEYNIHLKKIYLHGFSAGAHWGLVYGLYKADKFAAMALGGGGYMAYAVQTGVWPNNVPRKIPVDIHIGLSDPNLTIARDTRNQLTAAGHQVFYKEFNGGHTILPSHPQEIWNNLKTISLP